MQIEVRKPTEEEIKTAEGWPTWSKEISEFPWKYDETETCYILKGRATVTASDGQAASFGPGNWVIFPQGLECTWKIDDPIEKKYNFS